MARKFMFGLIVGFIFYLWLTRPRSEGPPSRTWTNPSEPIYNAPSLKITIRRKVK